MQLGIGLLAADLEIARSEATLVRLDRAEKRIAEAAGSTKGSVS